MSALCTRHIIYSFSSTKSLGGWARFPTPASSQPFTFFTITTKLEWKFSFLYYIYFANKKTFQLVYFIICGRNANQNSEEGRGLDEYFPFKRDEENAVLAHPYDSISFLISILAPFNPNSHISGHFVQIAWVCVYRTVRDLIKKNTTNNSWRDDKKGTVHVSHVFYYFLVITLRGVNGSMIDKQMK